MTGSPRLGRRRFLGGTLATTAALSGCVGRSGGSGDDGTPPAPPLTGHPAGQAIGSQPALGPEPTTAPATIVAFEDPSCPRCAAFERETVPRIRSELVERGRAAFVLRTIPVVYPWGEPAIQALEATYARDADAMWALADHYFAEQDAFDADNVLDRTRSFLGEETAVNADGVVADAEERAYDDAVQTDVEASEAADVSGTPTVFLFRDGRYRTRATGSVSFDLITRALGL
jgi:protein-disulfide isomerase